MYTPPGNVSATSTGAMRAQRQDAVVRHWHALSRWARRWLPHARVGIHDAEDFVQTTLLRALNRIDEFELHGDAGVLAYLRQILLNEIRGELRRGARRGEAVELDDDFATDGGDSVVEQAQRLERECAYADALRKLNPRQQRHVTLRVQFGMSFDEIAACAGGNADSARMVVTRAVRTLGAELAHVAA